jgi:hypothetical protein
MKMNKILANALFIGMSLLFIAGCNKSAGRTTAAGQQFDGWVSDQKCGVKIDPICARKCAAAGEKAVLVDADKNVIPVANSDTLKPFAGQKVSIKGKLDSGVLTVESVKAVTSSGS